MVLPFQPQCDQQPSSGSNRTSQHSSGTPNVRIILFRHGPAGSRDATQWPDDALRPLTPRGEERTRAAGHGLLELEPDLSIIFTSPFRRAEQTARVLAETCDVKSVQPLAPLAPGGTFRDLLATLAKQSPDAVIALVGHEPDLGKLAGTLVFGAPKAIALKKAGACAIEFAADVESGAGTLEWLLPPRALKRIGRRKEKV
jgi:phosphohistidine phosphatase